MLLNTWGMLGPEHLSSSRRTRTLGLGAAVRQFNELAVPGLGGVWFGKQVLLAMLGLRVAEEAREKSAKASNIEVANAIEALACLFAFRDNGWSRDGRLRGNTKLHRKDHDLRFYKLRQRDFYVTQPMRMATVQALPSLGFAEADGTRFNAFHSTGSGREFVELACEEFRPFGAAVLPRLVKWATGGDQVESRPMINALSPLQPLAAKASEMLLQGLRHGRLESEETRKRRAHALAWMERLNKEVVTASDWAKKPSEITDEHWRDLGAGARLFNVRDTAMSVLNELEASIGRVTTPVFRLNSKLPHAVESGLATLRTQAKAYLALSHTQPDARIFCKACECEGTQVLGFLTERDGRVLRRIGDEIRPGMAYTGRTSTVAEPQDDDAQPDIAQLPLPPGISRRISNLYLLNLDVHGKLDTWMQRQQGAAQA